MDTVYHGTQLPFVFSKVCKSCNPPTEKPIEEFDRDKSRPDGHVSRCKVCAHGAHNKRWHELHPPKEREQLSPEEEAKRERQNAHTRQYRLNNLEKDHARKRDYYAEHKEQISEQNKTNYQAAVEQYRAANPLPTVRDGYKICPTCKKEKILDDFYRLRESSDGHEYVCKECEDRAAGYKEIGKIRNRRGVPVTPGYKWCHGCKSEQLLSEFLEDETKWDGRSPRCHACRKAQRTQYWHGEKREQLLAAQRIRLRNLYESHIEYYRAYGRQKNKQPRYRLKFASTMSRRQAQKFATAIEEVDFRHIIERDGFHCYICDRAIDPSIIDGPARLTFDHVTPLNPRPGEPQGTHTADNIKPTHLVCNQRKGNRPFEILTPHQRRGPDV